MMTHSPVKPFWDFYRSPGFTLAELLVSISIVVLFTAVLLPSLSTFGRRNELRQGAQLVQSKILETKAYSLAPRSGLNSPIVQYRFIAPVTTPIPMTGGSSCTGEVSYAIVEMTQTDLTSGGQGTVVECLALPGGQTFTPSTPADQTVTFCVVPFSSGGVDYCTQGQGIITPQTGPEARTYTIYQSRLTAPNTRDIVIHRATGLVTTP